MNNRSFQNLDKGIVENDKYLLRRINLLTQQVSALQAVAEGTFLGLNVVNAAEGQVGSLSLKTATVKHTLDLANTSDTVALTIPVGSMLLGASFNVDEAVTTSSATDTWEAAFVDGSTTALVAASTSGALNTKADTLVVPEISATNPTEIQFTAPGAETFATGIIEVVVYYFELTSLDDA